MSDDVRGAEKVSKGRGKHREPEWPTVDEDSVAANSAPLPKRKPKSKWFTP